ncbi:MULTISPECIES: DUF2085 domain-containing protein [Methanosphaera]|uniref:DUF2085 domain-containing protein n=2 Tax=Methanosphaera stadtmanae TaxID=2317 RepID=A0A328PZ41_9EURY|nr:MULTISPECIES: DUF2085 domain-containing protein [Methanosphaera]ABC57125.1 hypothetical membrane-spanning protein [Methanosphaera stadtmanae DSM 3091]MDO5822483.1 DUF2085 domain-containing protein [Methanosphaera sp.]OEC89000.1 hypothetical protein A9758_03460 [Methanosphaera sp. A6]RAP03212.1 hypothetical protein CA615_03540 [Methanosphaera stadtmanae]
MKIINLICHRNPNRSFFIKGHQFPVCIRCTGCYLAISLYLIYTYYFYVDYTIYLIITAILLLIPMAIDGTTQLLTNRISNNTLRFITGFLGGLGLCIIFKATKYYIYLTI